MMTHRVLAAVCIVCEPVLEKKEYMDPVVPVIVQFYCVASLRFSVIVVCRPIAACGGLPSYVSCNLMNGIVR